MVVVGLIENGVTGTGECTPYPHYGESDVSALAQIMSIAPQLENGLTREELQKLLPAGATRNAADCASWDLSARQQQTSLAESVGSELAEVMMTVQTVVISSPEQVAANAAALWGNGTELLKVKLDARLIGERVVVTRTTVPDIAVTVDANESWRAKDPVIRCQLLAGLGVETLEQPLSTQGDAMLEDFVHPLPIYADESCHTCSSLKALYGCYGMANIKLDKTGGLTEALALVTETREQEFALMLGCMLCTPWAIGAALPPTPQASFADFDGPTWLVNDTEPVLRFTTGQLHLQDASAADQTWPAGISRSFHSMKWAEIRQLCSVNSDLRTSSQKSRAFHSPRW